jgi:aryl-alcohol dehydrogenase-like predicted oxidoreductase
MGKLILGTVQMGLDYGINNNSGKISVDNSNKILLNSYKLGITTLDTAEAYGNAHNVIGDFHRRNPEYKFKIVTKVPHDIEVNDISNKIKNYIEILNVEYLDVIMFHSFDSFVKNKNSILELSDLKSEGLINRIGVSVYTNNQIEYLIDDKLVSVVQLPFNLLDNSSVKGDLLKRLKSKGKIVHTRSAFLQGIFFKNCNFDGSETLNATTTTNKHHENKIFPFPSSICNFDYASFLWRRTYSKL